MQPTFISKYEVVNRIGTGGMGVLYLARDPDLDRTVAIKVMRGDFAAPDAEDRFAREGRALARLKHPNIVRVFDFGRLDDQLFLVMEYVSGETLAEFIARRPVSPLSERMAIFDQICAAVAYAHQQGWIHRDLKPSNIMLDTEEHAVKVLDFGLARPLEVGFTQHGMAMGSPGYAAPEQVLGDHADCRSDVFAASAVLYELLTYRRAFPGETMPAAIHSVLELNPPAAVGLNPDVSPELNDIIMRGLAKQPADRFPDMGAYREALRTIHFGLSTTRTATQTPSALPALSETVLARSVEPTVVRRSSTPSHDRRRFKVAWMLGAVMIVATAIAVGWFAVRQARNETARGHLAIERPLDATDILERAKDKYASGDKRAAITLLRQADGQSREVQQIASDWLAAAAADAENERRQVTESGQTPTGDLESAHREAEEADSLGRRGERLTAAEHYWAAADLYRAELARAAATSRAGLAQNESVRIGSRGAQPPSSKRQTSSGVDVQSDKVAIERALRRLADAFSRMDAGDVQSIMANAPMEDLQRSFSRYTRYRVEIRPTTITVQDGTATATCEEKREFTTVRGDTESSAETVVYELKRTEGTWRVVRSQRY